MLGDINNAEDKIKREENARSLLMSTLNDFDKKNELEEHSKDEFLMSIDESFNEYKEKFEESKKIKYPKVKPVGMSVMTSATLMNIVDQKHLISKEDFSLEMLSGLKRSVSDIQTVVAVGPNVNQVKVGDLVKIRFADFERVQNPNTVNARETFELPMETINGKNYLEIHERNIKYIYDS